MAELVSEALHMVGTESSGVVDHVEAGGRDSALTHALAHNEIVIPNTRTAQRSSATAVLTRAHHNVPLGLGDVGVHHSAWGRVPHLTTLVLEIPGADTLLHHHNSKPRSATDTTLNHLPRPVAHL